MKKINISFLTIMLLVGQCCWAPHADANALDMFKIGVMNQTHDIVQTITKLPDSVLLQGFRKDLELKNVYSVFVPYNYISDDLNVSEDKVYEQQTCFFPVAINDDNELVILLEEDKEDNMDVLHLSTMNSDQAIKRFRELYNKPQISEYSNTDLGVMSFGRKKEILQDVENTHTQTHDFEPNYISTNYDLLAMEYAPKANSIWVKVSEFLSGNAYKLSNMEGKTVSKMPFSSDLFSLSQDPQIQAFFKQMRRLNNFYQGELANALGIASYDTNALTKRANISNEVWGVKTAVLPEVAPEFDYDANVVTLFIIAKHPVTNDVRVLLCKESQSKDEKYYSGVITTVPKNATSAYAAMEAGISKSGAGFILDSVEMSKLDQKGLQAQLKKYLDNEKKASELALPYIAHDEKNKINLGVAVWALPYKTINELKTIQKLYAKLMPNASFMEDMTWVRLDDLINYLSDKTDILPAEGKDNIILSYSSLGDYKTFASPENSAAVRFLEYLKAVRMVNDESTGIDVETGLI